MRLDGDGRQDLFGQLTAAPQPPNVATFRSFEQNVLRSKSPRHGGAWDEESGRQRRNGSIWRFYSGRRVPLRNESPVAVTISGMESPEVLSQNLAVARGFKPLNAAEMDGSVELRENYGFSRREIAQLESMLTDQSVDWGGNPEKSTFKREASR